MTATLEKLKKGDIELFSFGNHKLARKIAIFNLMAGQKEICIGMTRLCAKVCYAKKPQQYSKQAIAKRDKNFAATLKPGFVSQAVAEITAAQVKHVRVHEAGDFYSQKYLKKWFKIAETLPHVKFLAYTKSFQLNFSACPDNFTLYLSRDSSSTPRMLKLADKHVKKYGFKIARMVMPGETPPKGYQTCTPYGLKEHYCAHVCHKCWIGKKNIYFDKH